MSQETITSYYEKDHDRLDLLFKQFQASKREDFAAAKNYFREFKTGLQRHIVWEEEILFPTFEEKMGMQNTGPTVVMRSEHRQIKAALEAIHEKIQRQDPNSDIEEEQLLSTLKQHNLKEEQILYPAIDRLVEEEGRKKIFQQMKELPAERYAHCCGEESREEK